jgi:hypothetical protein
MTNLFAISRDRDNEQRAIRAKHLEGLQETLRMDSFWLQGIIQRVSELGRFRDDDSESDKELQRLLYSEALSADLPNHFADYTHQKEQLRSDIACLQPREGTRCGRVDVAGQACQPLLSRPSTRHVRPSAWYSRRLTTSRRRRVRDLQQRASISRPS